MTVYSDEIVCSPRAGTLYDVLELILDRGMVIDVFVRVSLVGIEILKVDARIVIASVDTYLRFAEACNRLDLENDTRSKTVPELFGGPVSRAVGKAGAKRAAGSLTDKVRDVLTPDDGTEDDVDADEGDARAERASRPARKRRSDDDRPRPRRRKAEEE
jgi:hypothetical protein